MGQEAPKCRQRDGCASAGGNTTYVGIELAHEQRACEMPVHIRRNLRRQSASSVNRLNAGDNTQQVAWLPLSKDEIGRRITSLHDE
jgi:hypothetical protein